jgi:hypothetical protein
MAAPIDVRDYDNTDIELAANPSTYGYHHGLIPNHSYGFVPLVLAEERAT